MSYVETVGFPAGGDALDVALDVVLATGDDREGRGVRWSDDSGAVIVADAETPGQLSCLRPSFSPVGEREVKVGPLTVDPSCRFCATLAVILLDREGGPGTPALVDLADPQRDAATFVEDEVTSMEVVVLAETVDAWPNEEAFRSQRGETGLDVRAFVPLGLFAAATDPSNDPTAHVVVNGIVRTATERTNSATGMPFFHAVVTSLGGRVDVVASPDQAPDEVVPGNVLSVTGLLMGQRPTGGAQRPT